jgi:hypothetical protein
MRKIVLGWSWVALVVLSAGTAAATPTFPNAVQRDLSLTYSPPCSLCHVGGNTSASAVQTPFAKSMKARGLLAYDEATLQAALDQMTRDRVDSDHDGVSDVDELRGGTDPNLGSGEEPVTYGCTASGARSGPGGFGIGSMAMGLFLAVFRLRRRARGFSRTTREGEAEQRGRARRVSAVSACATG